MKLRLICTCLKIAAKRISFPLTSQKKNQIIPSVPGVEEKIAPFRSTYSHPIFLAHLDRNKQNWSGVIFWLDVKWWKLIFVRLTNRCGLCFLYL
jgi:hypothetical protein